MTFDYGVEPVASSGFKNPEVGEHYARIRSIIHLGMCQEVFNKTVKAPAPEAVIIFELQGEDNIHEDEQLTVHKAFPVKLGDRSTATKIRKAIDPKNEMKGLTDFIGEACSITLTGSKELGDDGKPKFINFGGISGIPKMMRDNVPPLSKQGVGHVTFENMTKEAVLELHPVREVMQLMAKGMNFEGSKAQKIVQELIAEDPEYGQSKKDSKEDEPKQNVAKQGNPEPKTALSEDEEF